MSSRVVMMVVFMGLLGGLSSIPKEQFSDTTSTVVKAVNDENMMTAPKASSSEEPYSMYFSDYYMIPSEKKFGGDRYDEFLYPPEEYYKQWAEEEREKDYMANNC